MSLINDALKRASQSDRSRPRQAAMPAAMEPAADPRRSPLLPALAAGVVVALALAGWFFWQWRNAENRAATPNPPGPAHVMIAAAPAPAPQPAKAAMRGAIVPRAISAVAPQTSPRENALDETAVPPRTPALPADKPWPSNLTVKAIFYSQTSPRALVSGKLVAPGDQIAGVVVSKIEDDRVVVQWSGQSKELLMGNQ